MYIHQQTSAIGALMLILLTSFSVSLSAKTDETASMLKAHFTQVLSSRQTAATTSRASFSQPIAADTRIQRQLSIRSLKAYEKMVWDSWCDAIREQQTAEDRLIAPRPLSQGEHSVWRLPETLEPAASMPYYYGVKGETDSARPLFIYLHGSGPKAGEWSTGLRLGQMFDDAPSAYFIPQIPNEGNYYRWWQVAKQYVWERLLRQAMISDDIDANRLYLFGISEGGYGSQRLASFYADYLAAAGPMAGGEPLKNAPVENCANIGFSFLTGAIDQGFYRNILTYYTQVAFDSAQHVRPLSADGQPLFRHRINLLPGMQHKIDYRLTTPWLKTFTRNPYPKTVLWEDFEMDGRHRTGFYNLQVLTRPSAGRTYYDMNITGNTITLSISDVSYTTTQTDKQWGIEMKFSRSWSEATGGRLRVYLNDRLVDMSREVTVIVNGRQAFKGRIKPDLRDMVNSCAEFFDPCRIYPASVDISY